MTEVKQILDKDQKDYLEILEYNLTHNSGGDFVPSNEILRRAQRLLTLIVGENENETPIFSDPYDIEIRKIYLEIKGFADTNEEWIVLCFQLIKKLLDVGSHDITHRYLQQMESRRSSRK